MITQAQPVTPCASDQAVWPWQAEPYRVWSLVEMVDKFPLSTFGAFLVDFERATAGLEVILNRANIHDDSFFKLAVTSFARTLHGVTDACRDANTPLSYAVRMQIEDFQQRLQKRDANDAHRIVEHARLTRQAILNDLSQHLFLYVDDASAKDYKEPLVGWERVVTRFGCAYDIEEGRKCYALGRYTASVFHLMKVVEAAVLELQMFLKDKDVKAHFGSVLSKLENMVQKTQYDHVPAHLQTHLNFLRDVLTHLHAVKDSWRNKVAHVDAYIVPMETFTPELAKGVHDASLMLMNKLVDGLPPPPELAKAMNSDPWPFPTR